MPHVDPKARSRIASRAANISWAQTPVRRARMAAAWAGRDAKWLREVDPDGVMDPDDRELAAESAKKAHYQELARRSAEKRRANSRRGDVAA